MARLKIKFNVEVTSLEDMNITSEPNKQEIDDFKTNMAELIRNDENVTVKIKNFKWEVIE